MIDEFRPQLLLWQAVETEDEELLKQAVFMVVADAGGGFLRGLAADKMANRQPRTVATRPAPAAAGQAAGGGGGKPIERIYEHNPKHKDSAYTDLKGNVVSRRPRGDCQSMLDCSVQARPGSPERIGTEPSTGLDVIFRRHLVQDLPTIIREFYHGFVPEG